MSRNQNRTGLPEDAFEHQEESPAPIVTNPPGTPQAAANTPAFNWATPTEFVKLPSGGMFYPAGHPLHNVDMIEIRYMTAKEEDILTSRSLLKEGLALDRMLQNLFIDSSIQVGDLLVGDKNALLVAARRTGYGAMYDTKVECPSCNVTDEFSFDLEDPPINNFREAIESDNGVTLTDDQTFVITLPMTEVAVECRLLFGSDELALAKQAERKSKRKQDDTTTTDIFRAYIVSVNGDPSPIMKETLIQNMPARDARYLRRTYVSFVPNIDMTQNYVCTNCGHEADMEVPLGVDFFWPE
jgi:hypothetical protein